MRTANITIALSFVCVMFLAVAPASAQLTYSGSGGGTSVTSSGGAGSSGPPTGPMAGGSSIPPWPFAAGCLDLDHPDLDNLPDWYTHENVMVMGDVSPFLLVDDGGVLKYEPEQDATDDDCLDLTDPTVMFVYMCSPVVTFDDEYRDIWAHYYGSYWDYNFYDEWLVSGPYDVAPNDYDQLNDDVVSGDFTFFVLPTVFYAVNSFIGTDTSVLCP